MNTKIVWRPLHRVPELQLALNCTGHEIGHINQVGDVWIACCAGRRVQRLSEAEAKAWVEERVRGDTAEDPRSIWPWLGLCIVFGMAALTIGCATAEPLPHYPCWDKKTQKYYECSDQEWMHQVILKELP